MRRVPWLVVAAACSLPSASEFARGTSDGGAGGGEPDGGTTLNPANDAGGLPETGTLPEAGIDGAVSSVPCPPTAAYCNDFSSGTVADIGTPGLSPTGSVAIVNGALEAKLEAIPKMGFNEAQVIHGLPDTVTKLAVDVDVFVGVAAWSAGGNMVILAIGYDGQPNDHVEELYISGEQTTITTSVNGGDLVYDGVDQNIKRGAWVHVRFEADFTPNQGVFRVLFDGQLVAMRSAIDFTPSTNVFPNVRLGLVRNNPPTPAITVLYDNLVITLP